MSLTVAKMTGSLKDQLLQDELDAKAELEAIQKDLKKESKRKVSKKKKDA